MQECKALDREEMIKRPRRDKRQGGPRKFVLVTKWDPRQPNIHGALKNMMNIQKIQRMLNASQEVPLLLGSEDKGILVKSLHQQNQLGQPEW